MRNRQGPFRQLRLTIAAAAILTTGAAGLGASEPPGKGDIAVTVSDLRNSNGVVRACITARPEHFPRCDEDPDHQGVTVRAQSETHLMFRGVKPGLYAIAILHDENENGKADRVLGMMPKEGFGFSRDAKVKMGPPKFAAAAFDYAGDAQVMAIRMRYLL